MAYPAKTDRETILSVAMKQVEGEGVEQLAIRSVAAALGLAPNALYRYFASLAALKGALAEESRRQLLEVMRKAAGRREPADAIRAIAKAYIGFARKRPAVLALTLKRSESDNDDNASHLQSWRFIVGLVSRLYGEKRAPEAALTLWALLHGMTVLQQAGVFGKEKPASSFAFGLQMWIDAASNQSH